MRTRGNAILLGFLLGGVGGHKFYLGRPIAGVFYLLFFWTLIPSFVATCEAIMYCTMSDIEFAQKYNGGMGQPDAGKIAKASAESLTTLAGLYERNLITKEEFDSKKELLMQKIV